MNRKSIFWFLVILMIVSLSFNPAPAYALDRASDLPAGMSAEDKERLSLDKEYLDSTRDDLEDRLDFLQDNCGGAMADPQSIVRCDAAEQFVQSTQTMYENRLETYEAEIQSLRAGGGK